MGAMEECAMFPSPPAPPIASDFLEQQHLYLPDTPATESLTLPSLLCDMEFHEALLEAETIASASGGGGGPLPLVLESAFSSDELVEMTMAMACDDDHDDDDAAERQQDHGHSQSSSEPTLPLSPLTADERKKRRNATERTRVHKVKDRIVKLREQLDQLQVKHKSHQLQLQRQVATPAEHTGHPWGLRTGSEISSGSSLLLRRYLALAQETDQLQHEKSFVEHALRLRQLHTTAARTLFAIEGPSDDDANGILRCAPVQYCGAECCECLYADRAPCSGASHHPPFLLDPMAVLESILALEPLTPQEATFLVEATCRDMMRAFDVHSSEWVTHACNRVAGWQADHCVDQSKTLLQFRLSQTFANASAEQLMHKTWVLLTEKDQYIKLQPLATQFKVLQKVNDQSYVIGITIGGEDPVRYSLLLVSRALIHGGYLITFRSLPLIGRGFDAASSSADQVRAAAASRHRHAFLKSESGGIYTKVESWYNFQDSEGGSCHVIFGGSVRRQVGSTDEDGKTTEEEKVAVYLQRLRLEVWAALTRWQTAVGFDRCVFAKETDASTGKKERLQWG